MTSPLGAFVVLAQSDGWHHMDFDDGGWWLMWIGMILFWALVILGIVWLVREMVGRDSRRDEAGALEILDRRLAEGEISTKEYQERRSILRGN
jgi:putative membrane protein